MFVMTYNFQEKVVAVWALQHVFTPSELYNMTFWQLDLVICVCRFVISVSTQVKCDQIQIHLQHNMTIHRVSPYIEHWKRTQDLTTDNCRYVSEGQYVSLCQILCRSVKQTVKEIIMAVFFDFSRWRPSAVLDLLYVCLDHPQSIWWSLSLRKIWLESVQ